jgi:hypothetical protein
MIFVYVYEQGNPPAICLPVNPEDKWDDFKENIRNVYKINPDEAEITYFDEPFQPRDGSSLHELGIGHKGLLKIKKQ